ncbi:MAG TPA: DoxX family protein [Candidatus Eisenbacteria bacterium]|nr:DoxX family protein [Candidatus Eisenbacteria bacterium]
MKSVRGMDVTLVLLRVVTGLLFMMHGGQKLLGWFGGIDDNGGTVQLGTLMGVAGILELFGGIAVLIGLLTRPIAFLLSGEMAFAYFMAHQPRGAWPIQNHGESVVLFSFIFLVLAFHGAGGFSIDSLFERRVTHDDRIRPVPRTVPSDLPTDPLPHPRH